MAEHSGTDHEISDGCAGWGPNQSWAVVWFFAVVLIGIIATLSFSGLDYFLYTTDAEVVDYHAHRVNRLASTAIGSGNKDPRTFGDLSSVRNSLSKK